MHRGQPRAHHRALLGEAVARMVIPTGVIGLRDRIHAAVERTGVHGRMISPHVHGHQAVRVAGMQPAGERLHVVHLSAVATVPGDLIDEVPHHDRRMQLGRKRRGTCLLFGFREQLRGARVPVSRPFDRAYALPHQESGRIQAFEQGGIQRVLGAHGICADRPQLADEGVLVSRCQRVSVPACVLLDRGAMQQQSLAVEVSPPLAPCELTQAHPGGEAALAAHGERQGVEIGSPGRPQGRFRHRHGAGCCRGLAMCELLCGEAQRDVLAAMRERALRHDRPLRGVVAHFDPDRHRRLLGIRGVRRERR